MVGRVKLMLVVGGSGSCGGGGGAAADSGGDGGGGGGGVGEKRRRRRRRSMYTRDSKRQARGQNDVYLGRLVLANTCSTSVSPNAFVQPTDITQAYLVEETPTINGVSTVPMNNENLENLVKSLQEQVNALLYHRQEDYNALEESLKHAIEKNTELIVLRKEVELLRKEVTELRGGSGNEAKNERLRVRWLGSAVTELQTEVAEVLRTRNASEELAERSRMRSELSLLKGDVAEVGRGIRNLGGRIAKFEAALGTIRIDITAVKERASKLSRTCADVASQIGTVQIELKSLKCDTPSEHKFHRFSVHRHEDKTREDNEIKNEVLFHESRRRHSYSKPLMHRIEERLNNLEHKISLVSRKRGMIEKRVVYENQDYLSGRIANLETAQEQLFSRMKNISKELSSTSKLSETMVELFETVQTLEDKVDGNGSDTKREIARLDINAARKAAELSLTREELSNLRRAVQALSVSASKLQERSDRHQISLDTLNDTLNRLDLSSSIEKASNITHELEQVEDQYRLIVDALPGNCDERDGLTLLAPGPGAPLLASCHKGWIVISRRIDGMVEFDRTWNDYAAGFGSPVNEFWIGNEALHRLTRDNCSRLKIDLMDIYGTHWHAEYEYFNIDSEESGYKLHVSGYSGNATDALSYQNNMAFSAKDRDMDISSTDCAANYHGGWWFSHCQHANLNGKYSLGLTWFKSNTNEWMAIASSEMAIQRKQNCR
ncbi:PREDICTED: protein scabrous-like isoform X1 [Polistes canadensis]|uniref:protein scabrous-like isoform X1 n=1 Tax=Polistes canadensis TaxID=91411 RepID=UPI000718D3FD|nr:PREDICTED: protein scabrous-like isoform X1 [Polistes canadensis]